MNLVSAISSPSYFSEGTLGHRALENHYKRIIENREKEEKDKIPYNLIIEQGRDVILTGAVEFDLPAETIEHLRNVYQQYAIYYKDDPWIPVAVEGEFSKVLAEIPELDTTITFLGKIDLIVENPQAGEGIVFPVDHKFVAQKTEYSRRSNQVIGYSWATDSNTLIINKVGKQKTLPPAEKFQRQILTVTPETIEEWKEQVIHKILEYEAYKESGFIPKRLSQCSNRGVKCMFYEICDSSQEMREGKLGILFKKNTSYHMGRE